MGCELWVRERGDAGLVAVSERDRTPFEAASARRYLVSAFGADLARVRTAMETLADAFSDASELERAADDLYERFRPAVAAGRAGWGQRGELRLAALAQLADERVALEAVARM
jgi:hypothetical protein